MLGEADLETWPYGWISLHYEKANQENISLRQAGFGELGTNISGVRCRFGLLMLADHFLGSTDTFDDCSGRGETSLSVYVFENSLRWKGIKVIEP